MTIFRTCHTCAAPQATCATREALKLSLAGLGVTSIKHRCADYRAAFLPGDAVKVQTFAWYHRDDDPPPKLWFPGHFIRLAGARGLVFVRSGAEDLNGEEITFEPNSNGYLKVPLRRIAHRDGPAGNIEACRWCASIPALDGNCGRDPNYTPSWHCLAAQHAALASSAEGVAVTQLREDQKDHPQSGKDGR